MSGAKFEFWASCESLGEALPALTAMIDAAKPVTYQTFRKNVGGKSLDSWATKHGYSVWTDYADDRRGTLMLKNDRHVGFFKSKWNGETVYYLVWSAFEMIWRLASCP